MTPTLAASAWLSKFAWVRARPFAVPYLVDKDMAPEKLVWASGPAQLIQELPWVGFTGDRYYAPMWVSPTFQDYTRAWMAIDPAGRGADKVGVCVMKYLNGYLFVRRWFGLTGGYEDKNLNLLASLTDRVVGGSLRPRREAGPACNPKKLNFLGARARYPQTAGGLAR